MGRAALKTHRDAQHQGEEHKSESMTLGQAGGSERRRHRCLKHEREGTAVGAAVRVLSTLRGGEVAPSGCRCSNGGEVAQSAARSTSSSAKTLPPAEVGSAGGAGGAFAWEAPSWWQGRTHCAISRLPVLRVRPRDSGKGLCELRARPVVARRIHPLANLPVYCEHPRMFRAARNTVLSYVLVGCVGVLSRHPIERGHIVRLPFHSSRRWAPACWPLPVACHLSRVRNCLPVASSSSSAHVW